MVHLLTLILVNLALHPVVQNYLLHKHTRNILACKWTGDQESYTPEKYILSSRLAMDSIYLDPASNSHANKTVNAETYYTRHTRIPKSNIL